MQSMDNTIRKIKASKKTDQELLEECVDERARQGKTSGPCRMTEWVTPPTQQKVQPPENTLFVVVNIPENKGAIRVFEGDPEQYAGVVGTESAGHMTIIPWNSNWWFRVSGSPTIAYVIPQ